MGWKLVFTMDPLQPRVRSDAGNVGNTELLTEVSRGVWIPRLWSILIWELKFKQHCVLGSHPCLAGRRHLPTLGLGSISGSYSINRA